jgi:putative peptide zinc metalloprotease protein
VTTYVDASAASAGDVVDARHPQRAPGVELLGEMPGSGYREPPSLVRRADGQTLQLTRLLYGVLEELDGESDFALIAERLSVKIGKSAAAGDVQYLVEKKLRPLGVLASADGSAPAAAKANPLLSLRPRVVVSNPAVTRTLTGPFARLFAPLIVLPLLLGFLAATGWVLFVKGLGSAAHQAFYQPGLLLAVFALTIVSAGFHEFGHAAAVRYGGGTPGTMGFGLYIVWPAFYTDVSDSYRLDRRHRLWVDLGGLYFNAIFCVVSLGLWFLTGWDALLLLIGTQVLQMLRQLTPVIRADGYHILADLTGVPDLFAHLKPTVQSVWPGNWGKRDSRTLKRWARVVVIAWVALIVPSLVFALVSGAVVMPRLIATAWDSLGVQWGALTAGAGHGDYGQVALSGVKMIAVVLPVAGTILMLSRIVLRTARRAWATTANNPRRRALVVVTAVAALLALGWAWWPGAQYQPIQAGERGTVLELPGALRAASAGPAARLAPAQRVASSVRMPAVLLVPRQTAGDPPRPALVVLKPANGGAPTVLTVAPSPGSASGANPWPFPFPPPGQARPGDNRAVTVNTTDGSAVYDVAFSMVWVSGQGFTGRNDAIALADCTHCRTVSVAFQTVFLLGQNDTVAPVNTSQALNYGCRDCHTSAIAVQLVVSLTSLPDPSVLAQLDGLWRQLDQLATDLPKLSDDEIYARLKSLEGDILRTLAAAGPEITSSADNAAAATSPQPAGVPSPGPSVAATASLGASSASSSSTRSGTAAQSGGGTTATSGAGEPSTAPSSSIDTGSTASTGSSGTSSGVESPAPSAAPSAAVAEGGSTTG